MLSDFGHRKKIAAITRADCRISYLRAQLVQNFFRLMTIDDAEAVFQGRMVDGVGLEYPFQAERMDGSDP